MMEFIFFLLQLFLSAFKKESDAFHKVENKVTIKGNGNKVKSIGNSSVYVVGDNNTLNQNN